jgi:alpha-beta hydrolase superfamily lysophospholipase
VPCDSGDPADSNHKQVTGMTYVEETVTASDGLRLFVRRRNVANARGEIVLVHGFGEHSGRYDRLGLHLNAHGYSVTAYDHRGHGLSDGLPGHVESFSEYENDLDRIIAAVRGRSDARPIFLIGHSMGGLVALRYLATRSSGLAAAVISAPLIGLATPVPVHKLILARVMARLAPHMRLNNEINPAFLSRDPEVGTAYATDPLVTRKVSARWFAEATRAMQEVNEMAPRITLPLIVMHGSEDRLASVDATKQLFERIGASDKELVIYPGFYHELFNEPEKQEVFDRVTAWLEKELRMKQKLK